MKESRNCISWRIEFLERSFFFILFFFFITKFSCLVHKMRRKRKTRAARSFSFFYKFSSFKRFLNRFIKSAKVKWTTNLNYYEVYYYFQLSRIEILIGVVPVGIYSFHRKTFLVLWVSSQKQNKKKTSFVWLAKLLDKFKFYLLSHNCRMHTMIYGSWSCYLRINVLKLN